MIDELFQRLVQIPSVSGDEVLLQKIVSQELSSYSDVKFGDILNNFTVQVGNGDRKTVVTAHADEVGFIVTYINEEGFIYFQPVGGIDPDIAVGQLVTILTERGNVQGIIGRQEVWPTASSEDLSTIVPFKNLWIDIGLNKKASELVRVGDPVCFATSITELPENYVLSRGADDKLGVYVLIQLVKNLAQTPNPDLSLFAVTTTQEEVGSRGATPAVNRIQPQYAIIIDAIRTTDIPQSDIEEIGKISLGDGPIITRGSNTNTDLFVILEEIAKREQIPYQIEADAGPSATDADPIQISGIGTATIVVGVPVRYMHMPAQIFSWVDVENTIKLLTLFLKNLRGSSDTDGRG